MTMSDDKFRLMDTIVRVRGLGASLDFYTRLLGMKLLRKMNFPERKFTLAFVGYGPEDTHAALELAHNWDQAKPYDLGTGCGHIRLGVRDIYGICKELEQAGAKIPRPPGPMKHGTTHIALEDPEGHKIELIDLDTRG